MFIISLFPGEGTYPPAGFLAERSYKAGLFWLKNVPSNL